MSELDTASTDKSGFRAGITRVDSILSGEEEGIISKQFKTDDFDSIEGEFKSAKSDAEDDPSSSGKSAKFTYLGATLRDVKYGCVGRKFMRATAMTARSRALYGRGSMLNYIDKITSS